MLVESVDPRANSSSFRILSSRVRTLHLREKIARKVEAEGLFRVGGDIIWASRIAEKSQGPTLQAGDEIHPIISILAQQAALSFTLDPAGFDWIDRNYRDMKFTYGTEDIAVRRYSEARQRYQELYIEALANGAKDEMTKLNFAQQVLTSAKIWLLKEKIMWQIVKKGF